jgi:hypothetical protein
MALLGRAAGARPAVNDTETRGGTERVRGPGAGPQRMRYVVGGAEESVSPITEIPYFVFL